MATTAEELPSLDAAQILLQTTAAAPSSIALAPSAAASSSSTPTLLPFTLAGLCTPPVLVIHGPRGSGLTSLIASLLVDAQRHLKLDAAIVLTDRGVAPAYMGGLVPSELVHDQAPDKVLDSLVCMQIQRQRTLPGMPLPRIALAIDDMFYNKRTLRSEAFQRHIKQSKDLNIMLVIATSDAKVLPDNVPAFATHVLATKSVSLDERKTLMKCMFVMFDSPRTFMDALSALGAREFLVGSLRVDPGGDATVRSYRAAPYVGKGFAPTATAASWSSGGAAAAACPGVAPQEASLTVDPQLLFQLSTTIERLAGVSHT